MNNYLINITAFVHCTGIVYFYQLIYIYKFIVALGNDNMAGILNSKPRYILRVDVEDFNGNKRFAIFSNFKINPASNKYKLVSVGTYSGTAGILCIICSVCQAYSFFI